ncbi:MAG TPA: thiamine pyrophosphate-dependent dehydrogenase E1 component subunit alpha [bacterium]|nr:thiamine pyrophosphate-dependent dehydrogenase E1 component subunit alpha [bacterium]
MSPTLDEAAVAVEKSASGKSVSRRSFLKGMAATGVGMSVLATGLKSVAHAQQLTPDLTDAKLVDMYAKMLRMRWWDRTYGDILLTDQNFRSWAHIWYPYAGQEAVAVGVTTALNQDDWIATTWRGAGHMIAKGGDLKKMTAGITMKATGLNGGYGASMHWTDKSIGYLFSTGIVGPNVVLMAGVAAGIKQRGTKQVAVAFASDGAHASPYFHVALNEAALLKLPLLYIIENNLYAGGAYYKVQNHLDDIATSAKGYDIPGVVVDGQNVLAVFNAAKTAVARARAGDGPTLIEAKTYRYYGHSGGAGVKVGRMGSFGLAYRPDREVLAWMARDPVEIQKTLLLNLGIITEAKAEEMVQAAKAEVAEAFKFAADSPVPKAADALRHVYSSGGPVAARQFANTKLF